MWAARTSFGALGRIAFMIALAWPLATSTAAEEWLAVAPNGELHGRDGTVPATPRVTVAAVDELGLAVTVDVAGVSLTRHATPAGEFVLAGWPDVSLAGDYGEPAIPVVRRLFVVPEGATVDVQVTAGETTSVGLATHGFALPLVPVQAPIKMIPGARESAPFHYDELAYHTDMPWPAERAVVSELGLVRGQRLFVLEVRPVSYNPAAGTLLLWPHLGVDLRFDGGRAPIGDVGPLAAMSDILLNPPPTRGRDDRNLNYLIVVAEDLADSAALAEFVTAKTAHGYNVITYSVPPGTSAADIKAYIQSLWGTPAAPEFLLLVGDSNTIPAWTGGGDSYADTDLPYACMDAGDDWLPDITVGRFPVRLDSQLQAIVDKTLYVEAGNYEDPEYVRRASFVAGNDASSGDHAAHEQVIESYLEPRDYWCEELYYRVMGADTEDVQAAINDGRIFCVYFGHSSSDHWFTPSFYTSDVLELENVNRYGIVIAFSCNTARFTLTECLGETFVRQAEKGAAIYLGTSTYIYYTDPPWVETADLYDDIFFSVYQQEIYAFGAALYNACYHLLIQYGHVHPVTRDYFEMFIVLGDPSLEVPTEGGFTVIADPVSQDVCAPAEAVYTIDVQSVFGFEDAVTLTASGAPAGTTVDFSVNDLPPPFTAVMTVSGTGAALPGDYSIEVTGTAGDVQKSTYAGLSLYEGPPNEVTLTSPLDGEVDVVLSPTLVWEPLADAWEYEIEVAYDPEFAEVEYAVTSTAASHTVDVSLLPLSLYFWRVRAINACGEGAYPAPWSFTTLDMIMPTAYDMYNGQSGTYTYFDDLYDGAGDPTTPLSWLSGGLGDLTDGVIATENWNHTPEPYVGWNAIDPTMTIHFDGSVKIRQVTVSVDDSNGLGGVYPPSDVIITMGGTTLEFSIEDPPASAPFSIDLTDLGLAGDTMVLTVYDVTSSHWQMISEVQWFGSLLPMDFDGDGDVDFGDYSVFEPCLAGPEVSTPPPGVDPDDFDAADFDSDNDVDLGDFGRLQVEFTG